MTLISEVLNKFCDSSGLSINLEKSRAMCSHRMSRAKKAELASLSPIQFTSDLGRYLGFPLVRGRVKKSDHFNFLLEKINSRLAPWKGKLLNKARRVALSNSVHAMQTMWVPSGICDALDSKVRTLFGRIRILDKDCTWLTGRKLLVLVSLVAWVLEKPRP